MLSLFTAQGPGADPFRHADEAARGQAIRAWRAHGPGIHLPRRFNPSHRSVLEMQRHRSTLDPRPWPPFQTEIEAAAQALNRYRFQQTAVNVKQPAYDVMPSSGSAFTFTDSTVSTGTIVLPAGGADQVVVTFQVPVGRNGVIQKISNQLVVGGFQDGSGNVLWRLTINGVAVKGFNAIKASIGSMSNPADFSANPIRIYENDTVQLIINNVGLFAGQGIIQGMLRGYDYSIAEETEATWQ